MRFRSLDSLRGVCALAVVFHHCRLLDDATRARLDATVVLRAVAFGPTAVYIFFLLSGFVLYLACTATSAFSYRSFLIKRFLRIYPPLLVAVVASVGLYLLVYRGPIPQLSDWFNTHSWTDRPTAGVLGKVARWA